MRLRTALGLSALSVLVAVACGPSSETDPGAIPTDDGGGGGGVDGAPSVPPDAKKGRNEPCAAPAECESGICEAGKCGVPTGNPNGEPPGAECAKGADCTSGVCTGGKCAEPTAKDGVMNGDETDVDCGGAKAPKCEDGKGCAKGADCESLACDDAKKVCTAPSFTDGVKNGDETDVDCGGDENVAGFRACADGNVCGDGADCTSKVCGGDKKCAAPTYVDTVQNGDETDVDCGGNPANVGFVACAPGKTCAAGTDCASSTCNAAKKCAWGKGCAGTAGATTCGVTGATEDCCKRLDMPQGPNGAAKVDKYLITAGRMRSFLTAVNGDVRSYITNNKPGWWDNDWTDWLPDAFEGSNRTTVVQTTGDIALPAGYAKNVTAAYSQVGGAIIDDQPGSQGCWLGSSVGHPTYFVPKAAATNLYGDNYDRWLTEAQLDAKPLNCTPYVMFAAYCAWEGGQVISEPEYRYIYDNDHNIGNGESTYPWGSPPAVTCVDSNGQACTTQVNCTCTPGAGYDKVNNPHIAGQPFVAGALRRAGPGNRGFTSAACPECELGWANWLWSFQFPGQVPANATQQRDQSFYISNPGMFPKAASTPLPGGAPGEGVADMAGLFIEILRTSTGRANRSLTWGVNDPPANRTANVHQIRWRGGSFEGHGVRDSWTFTSVNKYGKAGSRCVYY